MMTLDFEKIKERFKQFRYPMLVIVLGICLMIVPVEKKQAKKTVKEDTVTEVDLAVQMEELLSMVEGAGKVRVLLTLENGPINQFQENIKTGSGSSNIQKQTETVLVSVDGEEQPVTVKTTYPTYKGAVVVCQGAERASVKLKLIQAVSSLTGLSSDHITVVKMQGD